MGRTLQDLVGKKFGKLTVLSLNEDNYSAKKEKIWDCKCDCGNFITVSGDYLRSKNITPSCGCNKFINSIIGNSFGDLTVIDEYRNQKNKIRYICQCSCGNAVDISRYDLINGKKTNCGCKKKNIRPNRYRDLTGQKFGRLTAIKRDENEYYTKGGTRIYKWICKCDCGNDVIVERQSLISGHTKSCGCLQAEQQGISIEEYRERYKNIQDNNGKFIDLTGQRFGKLTVLYRDYNSKKYTKWVCACDCGNVITVTRNNLISGHTQSCGCIDSVGESTIAMYLSSKNIMYKKEYTFNDCRDIHPLPFDFGIKNNNGKLVGLIEFDGVQHFQPVRFNGMTQECAESSFQDCVKHDNMKNNYCTKNNIPLLRIKYSEIKGIHKMIDIFLMKCGIKQVAA